MRKENNFNSPSEIDRNKVKGNQQKKRDHTSMTTLRSERETEGKTPESYFSDSPQEGRIYFCFFILFLFLFLFLYFFILTK